MQAKILPSLERLDFKQIPFFLLRSGCLLNDLKLAPVVRLIVCKIESY